MDARGEGDILSVKLSLPIFIFISEMLPKQLFFFIIFNINFLNAYFAYTKKEYSHFSGLSLELTSLGRELVLFYLKLGHLFMLSMITCRVETMKRIKQNLAFSTFLSYRNTNVSKVLTVFICVSQFKLVICVFVCVAKVDL